MIGVRGSPLSRAKAAPLGFTNASWSLNRSFETAPNRESGIEADIVCLRSYRVIQNAPLQTLEALVLLAGDRLPTKNSFEKIAGRFRYCCGILAALEPQGRRRH